MQPKIWKKIKSKLNKFSDIFVWGKKTPIIKDNTFIVWEACSASHSEVVPGFVKYLHDFGFHVSVLVEPKRLKEGLFSRFNLENVSYNKMTSKESRKFFKHGDLSKVKGIIVTTAGKLCDCIHYEQCYEAFNDSIDKKHLLFVEHDLKDSVDAGTFDGKIIMLREMDYKGAKPVAVNPHYFGNIDVTLKNVDIVNFLTVGVIKPRKKNNDTIIDAVLRLHKKGVTNFKVTVVGKGKIKDIPKEIRKYFDIKGRLPFDKMYKEIEKADFLLTSYDDDNERHLRYITTGTSGNFQLIYGFLKPCLIAEKFAPINGFDTNNSIIYKGAENYSEAMEQGINMSAAEYAIMQDNLKKYVDKLYEKSSKNLKEAIDGK